MSYDRTVPAKVPRIQKFAYRPLEARGPPDPLMPQRARSAPTGVDEDCGKILRCSAGCFAGLGAAAAAAGFRVRSSSSVAEHDRHEN